MKNESLIAHIAANSSQLKPVESGELPLLGLLDRIEAVVFDIYGTLFISGCGDISLIQDEDRSPALCASLEAAGYVILDKGNDWSQAFFRQLDSHRENRSNEGIDYPEVRIEEVWKDFIDDAQNMGWLDGSGNIDLAIVDYECRVNPCWPMPHLQTVLSTLKEHQFPLGIVSNAQFYTPLMFPAFLDQSLESCGFHEAYSVWSYQERIGKPSESLYRKLRESLQKNGIPAGSVLYVGNDLRNDIWPAQKLGFRTALFAGDKRSLRWREKDPDCDSVLPDRIITDLRQILEMVSL